jgi:hypothetical protein
VIDQIGMEPVDAGRHRRMRGEYVPGRRRLASFGKRKLVFLHQRANAFQSQEGRMALVHVVDGGAQAQRRQGTDTADAQQDFLANAQIMIAAVKLVGDVPIFGPVVGDVGVEQAKGHPPHLRAPHLGFDHPAGILDLDRQGGPAQLALEHDGQVVEIVLGI